VKWVKAYFGAAKECFAPHMHAKPSPSPPPPPPLFRTYLKATCRKRLNSKQAAMFWKNWTAQQICYGIFISGH